MSLLPALRRRAALLLPLLLAPLLPASAADAPVTWDTMNEILARIKAPTFPDRDFPITNYGAVAGGTADCTDAIAKAIAAASAAGGGRVVVPAGVFLTGAVHLKSNVNLHVAEGATLRFTPDPAKYPVVFTRWEGVECMNYSPLIYAYEQENIAVTGKGILDGGASDENWWGWARTVPGRPPPVARASRNLLMDMNNRGVPVAERVFGPGHYLRPNFIQPYKCKNVLVEGLTINNSPMWEVHPVLCSNVIVRGLTIVTHGPNNDGCNPESSRDVLIEDTLFDTGDDCIAIKSGRNDDGRRLATPTENVIIRNCFMKEGHGGVVLGSEISGGVRNVFVENCKMDSPELDRALRFKNNALRGGVLENVFMRNVTIGQVREAVITVDFLYEEGANGPYQPIVRNVYLENVTSSASPRVLYVVAFPGSIIDNIQLKNSTFKGLTAAEVIIGAGRITYDNVVAEPLNRPRSASTVAPPAPPAPPPAAR